MGNNQMKCPHCGHYMRQLQMPMSSPWYCDNCEEDDKTDPGLGPKHPHPSGCQHKKTYKADFPGWGVGTACVDCGHVLSWEPGNPFSTVQVTDMWTYTRNGEIENAFAEAVDGYGYATYKRATKIEVSTKE